MNDIDITLFLNEYRVKALEEALGNRTAETIEDKASNKRLRKSWSYTKRAALP